MAPDPDDNPAGAAPDRIPVGAHLVTPRLGYLHHGIYAGGGTVIQYSGLLRAFPRGAVEEVPLEAFARGCGIHVQRERAARFSGAERVARARTRLGERRYRLLSNNCEHFSQWCVSGTSRSPQVEAWKARLRGLLGALGMGRRPVTSEISGVCPETAG